MHHHLVLSWLITISTESSEVQSTTFWKFVNSPFKFLSSYKLPPFLTGSDAQKRISSSPGFCVRRGLLGSVNSPNLSDIVISCCKTLKFRDSCLR